ncbi:MAG: LCP family protein [Solirubrobacteraceae bacterium]
MSADQGAEGPNSGRPRYPPRPSSPRGGDGAARGGEGAGGRDGATRGGGRGRSAGRPEGGRPEGGRADAGAPPRRLTPRTPAGGGASPYGGRGASTVAPPEQEPPGSYRTYRARHGSDGGGPGVGDGFGGEAGGPRRRLRIPHLTPKRAILGLLALVFGWIVLALLLFLISSHFERIAPPTNVSSALEPAGNPLTSANNILVLGSDKREKTSKEPGANPSGPSRSDTIMLIRTGGGHSARLSIPRDTVIEIPGHGLQKINAAYAFGGPRFSIEVIKKYLGVPINHVVEVNFESFPALIDSMGGVTYTGGCIDSEIAGGVRNGGYTLKLPAGTHHLDGRQALVLARTRHNACAPNQDDINREEHQQALFEDMKKQLLSPMSFIRLPLIAWNTPPAIISDMSGETLLALFASLAVDGKSPTKILRPTGVITLPDGEEGLTVSEASKHRSVAEFMKG